MFSLSFPVLFCFEEAIILVAYKNYSHSSATRLCCAFRSFGLELRCAEAVHRNVTQKEERMNNNPVGVFYSINPIPPSTV